MNLRKSLGFMVVLLFAFAFIPPAIHASDKDQETLLTFGQPVRIPGTVLRPGSYWFVVVTNDGRIVEILNAHRTKVIEMIETVRAERAEERVTGTTVLTFAEPRRLSTKNPAALLTWFYPGHMEGHEFIYSPPREKQINREEHVTVDLTASSVPWWSS